MKLHAKNLVNWLTFGEILGKVLPFPADSFYSAFELHVNAYPPLKLKLY
jgi:hypothetical protein